MSIITGEQFDSSFFSKNKQNLQGPEANDDILIEMQQQGIQSSSRCEVSSTSINIQNIMEEDFKSQRDQISYFSQLESKKNLKQENKQSSEDKQKYIVEDRNIEDMKENNKNKAKNLTKYKRLKKSEIENYFGVSDEAEIYAMIDPPNVPENTNVLPFIKEIVDSIHSEEFENTQSNFMYGNIAKNLNLLMPDVKKTLSEKVKQLVLVDSQVKGGNQQCRKFFKACNLLVDEMKRQNYYIIIINFVLIITYFTFCSIKMNDIKEYIDNSTAERNYAKLQSYGNVAITLTTLGLVLIILVQAFVIQSLWKCNRDYLYKHCSFTLLGFLGINIMSYCFSFQIPNCFVSGLEVLCSCFVVLFILPFRIVKLQKTMTRFLVLIGELKSRKLVK